MVNISFDSKFKKKISKLKDQKIKIQVKKLITKILENPLIGKLTRYQRIGTQELYLKPNRISYKYYKKQNQIVFLNYSYKDKQ